MKKTIYVIWRIDHSEPEESPLLACESMKLAKLYVRRIKRWLDGIPRPRYQNGTLTNASFKFPLLPLLGNRYDQTTALYDLEGLRTEKKNTDARILYIKEMELHDAT